MGTEYYCDPAVPYEEALRLLQASDKVLVEEHPHPFMLELGTQRTILSLDRQCWVQMASLGDDLVEYPDSLQPRGSVWFFKFAPYDQQGRRFASLVADIIGAKDIRTYYGCSVRDPGEAQAEFGPEDKEI